MSEAFQVGDAGRGIAPEKMNDILYDKDIREPLFEFLEERYGKIRILEEKRTGSARADCVMITPTLIYDLSSKTLCFYML